MLKWSEEYFLNQPQIDREHQGLFKLLNDFYQGLANGSSKEKLGGLIEGLLNYTKVHFSNEEEYMRSIQFPGLEKHQKKHREFIEKASEFHEKHNSGKLLLSIEVTNFIKDWITNHIKTEDKQYARHARL